MLTRILFVGLTVGAVVGLAIAILQQFTTTPLILKAETYEAGSGGHDHHTSFHGSRDPLLILVHGDTAATDATESPGATGEAVEPWAPQDGFERAAYTTLTTIGTAVGFALMLLAFMLLAGEKITMAKGLAWGAAAYVAAGLAPAFGLAPELPGAAAVDVVGRQTWWLATLLATAAGLLCFLKSKSLLIALGGLALIAIPHVIGAPHPHELASKVPAELAAQFTAMSLGLQAALWAMIGAGVGALWERGETQAGAT